MKLKKTFYLPGLLLAQGIGLLASLLMLGCIENWAERQAENIKDSAK